MRFAIVTPTGNSQVCAAFANALFHTERAYPGKVEWISAACTDLSFGRNALLYQAWAKRELKTIVWIDGDESWTPDDLAAVLAPIEEGKAEVVGAVVPAKKPNATIYQSLLFYLGDLEPSGYAGPTYDSGKHVYWRTRRIGTGFLAMSRTAIDKVMEFSPKYAPPNASFGAEGARLPWFFGAGVYEGEALTEDMRACELLAEYGVEIWLSLDASPVHWLGSLGFSAGAATHGAISQHARAQALRSQK